jgi:superfamily II DNA or RNA helicase
MRSLKNLLGNHLKIYLKNDIHLQDLPLDIRDSIMAKLKIPNPKWLENNRMGRWNKGTPEFLKFYQKSPQNGLRIPRGYMRHMILLCRHHGLPCEIEDQRRNLPPVEISFNGQLKSFQRQAADAMLKKEFGALTSPTGSGKTIIALYMIAKRRQPALIVVHTKDLAFQWIDRITSFLNIPAGDVGFIGSGKKKIGEKITVALVQSLYKCADEVAPFIGYLVVDECHRCPSRTFTEAVTCFDARYMLGLSATPWRRDKLSKLIFWHLGDVHHEVDPSALVEKGHILQAEVIIRHTAFKPYYDPVNEYSKMLSELTADDARNHLIASDVAQEIQSHPGVCLVLSDRKKHCDNLRAILLYKFKVSAELMTGDLSGSQRKDVLDRLNQGKVKVLIATGQLMGEGFDCRDLSTLFLATPIRFNGRVIQYLGRVLRPAPGKNKARVFDYVDVKVTPLLKAAEARQRVYQGLP